MDLKKILKYLEISISIGKTLYEVINQAEKAKSNTKKTKNEKLTISDIDKLISNILKNMKQ